MGYSELPTTEGENGMKRLDTLPPVGQLVTVRELAFGGREVTGRILAGDDGGPILEQSPNGVQLVRLEREDGTRTSVAWCDDPAKVEYVVHGEASSTETHPEQEPRTQWRKRTEPPPLTEEALAAEMADKLAGLGKSRPAPAELPDDLEDRMTRELAVQQKRVAEARRGVKEAEKTFKQARKHYFSADADNDGEALQAFVTAQQALTEAQARLERAEQAAPLQIVRELARGWKPPAWLWLVLAGIVLAVLGPVAAAALAVVLGLPLLAFLIGFRR